MNKHREAEPISTQTDYFPETLELLGILASDPTHDFRCSHGDNSPAVGIYEVPGGCVALPGLQTQSLCPQHVVTNGSFEGMRLVVDLSEGGVWSSYQDVVPDYFIDCEPDSEQLVLVATTEGLE